jgi:hypothetical protein
MNPAEKLKMMDELTVLKSKRWDLVIELNETNAKLSQIHGKKIKTIDKRQTRQFLVAKKYEIENELIRTKREIAKLSDTTRQWKRSI